MVKQTITPLLCTVLAALLLPHSLPAADTKAEDGPRTLAIHLGAPFHDHAVLQRDM